jgi:hypothetical protein
MVLFKRGLLAIRRRTSCSHLATRQVAAHAARGTALGAGVPEASYADDVTIALRLLD